jgi:hypothetical protein
VLNDCKLKLYLCIMKFRTEVAVEPALFPISHKQPIACIGSCFAENIADKLAYSKFKTLVNPFGILFHPLAVSTCIDRVIQQKYYTPADLILHDGIYHSPDHHSDFSHTDAAVCIEQINASIDEAHSFLQQAEVLIITLGSAVVFEYLPQQKIVANCHKIPNNKFKRSILSVGNIVSCLAATMRGLKAFNPRLRIIATVSPVRYLSHGFHNNQLSKATLLLALDALQQTDDSMRYFPAYEIMIDDLRDYRFVAEDMAHPNQLAIDYIWEKFSVAYFDAGTLSLLKELQDISAACHHRPRNANTDAHRTFLATNAAKVLRLKEKHPYLPLDAELAYFEGKSKN